MGKFTFFYINFSPYIILLIFFRYYRTAVNLTGRLLSIYGQGYNCAGQTTKNTPHSLQLWFTRLALLLKLGLFDLCQTEASNFGMLNRPDMFYEFYPDMYKEKRGSMVCFSFRLLLADLPQYLNKPKQSIDRLVYMNSITEQIIQHYESIAFEDAKVFWKNRQRRIFHSIINAGLMVFTLSKVYYVLMLTFGGF
jgi:trafficking protein particle complex subunit 12